MISKERKNQFQAITRGYSLDIIISIPLPLPLLFSPFSLALLEVKTDTGAHLAIFLLLLLPVVSQTNHYARVFAPAPPPPPVTSKLEDDEEYEGMVEKSGIIPRVLGVVFLLSATESIQERRKERNAIIGAGEMVSTCMEMGVRVEN